MTRQRRTVLEALAAESDATTGRWTTVASLADALDADRSTVRSHLEALEACALARIESDERVRVTITGEELLALDLDDGAVVDPVPADDRN
jgi:DNA-binding transcriptional ArsR family regulator